MAFPVVGIGASAGGIPAVMRLLENVPAGTGMAFVVVLHLAPDRPSAVDNIFQRATSMRVREVTDDLPIEPNHVYVIPPSRALFMNDGHLRLGPLERTSPQRVAIDLFFRSLGEVHRERAVAIVLSGAGADGSQGLRRVKERGGITLVQSPADAEYEVMPLHAIATGLADFVLPVADMPQRLIELWNNAKRIELPHPPANLAVRDSPTPQAVQRAEDALQTVLRLVRDRTGHDFSHYKRATVLRRIERRMQVSRQPTLPDYATHLQSNEQEMTLLLQDMLISVTNFFRDRQAFEALERALIKDLFEVPEPVDRLRAWVAGCASGEEAYSVAMLLLEHAKESNAMAGIQVFATDVDERALSVGRAGLYAESIATDVPPVRLRDFFDREPGQYRVARALRERVTFSVHNLLNDPPFSRLHLMCCRNLLIYLDRDAQRQLLETFHFALRPGGLLFLGSAETADAAPELFTVVDRKHRLYRASTTIVERRVPAGLVEPLAYLVLASSTGVLVRQQILDDIRKQLLGENDRRAVVVDQQLRVVYMSDQANRFLHLYGGELSAHLLKLVVPELRLALKAALAHSLQTSDSVQARRIRLQRGDRSTVVSMTVRPLGLVHHAKTARDWLIVLFDEEESEVDDSPDSPTGAASAAEAQWDLTSLHEQLSAAIGESDSSNEALRAANEELQSLNEELRSTAEELETSKEELQSVNEELSTVNNDLKLNLEATAKANDDLQNFIAASDIATIFVDRTLRIQRFTPPATTIFNLLGTDVGRPLFDITHRLDYSQMEQDACETFESLRPIEREVRGLDGRWFLARVLPYRSSTDHIEGAVLNFIDITARHQAEEQVRAAEERLRLLFESIVDYVIIVLDPEGRVTRWNKGAEQVLGYTEREVLGQSCDIIFTPEDRAAGAAEEERRRAREDRRAQDERWHLRKDGSRVYLSGVLVMMADSAEKGFAKIARDLTQARMATQEREALLESERSLRAQLESAGEMKDEFLAVMSHELKNPLNLIALNANLLALQPATASTEALARIARNIGIGVRSQAQLIDDLLDLSRMQTGKLTLHLEDMHLDQVVERVVDAMQPDARARGVALNLHVGPANYCLHADPVRIEQIVWNLLSNALKFSPDGSTISVKLAAIEIDIAEVWLEVTDTGQGIDPRSLPLVFEMFQQADAHPTTRRKSGLGIGLAIVKRLVEAHGGQVDATSEGAGRGATFTVVLPRRSGPLPEGIQDAKASTLRGARILLVEDELQTLETFRSVLESAGAVLTTASSGEEALAKAAPGLFDLIVSDIAMPGMDGYALLARLREAGLRDVPALAVTGFARPADRKRALAAGFNEHLGKPLELEALLGAIEHLHPRGFA